MLENYFPVFIFVLIGAVFGVAPVITGRVVAPHRPDEEKLSAYECGFEAFEDARMKFDVRYYLISILFILFDLEVAFLLPWATIAKELASNDAVRLFGFSGMFVFLGILEHVADARSTDANEHFDKIGAGNTEERHLGFASDGLGKQCLTGTRIADHQHPLRNTATELLEL